MTRLEKTLQAKQKRKKYNKICKFMFIFSMITILVLSVIMIDMNVNLMFGEVEKYNIEVFLGNMGISLEETKNEIGKLIEKIETFSNK